MMRSRTNRRTRGFTLVELLTVVFIVGVLISILVPAVNSARNAAKNAKTASTLRAIDAALEMFKSDNGSSFPNTNGYPPSFAHPKIKGANFNAWEGQFPFHGGAGANPRIYGAQWLPAMLIGKDLRGYVKRSDVPGDLRDQPHEWYENPPMGEDYPLPRAQLYLNPDEVRILNTEQVPGRSLGGNLFPDWETMKDLPVITDSYDQPILYYAANTHGSDANMLSGSRQPDGDYSSEGGPPVYFHQDNVGYTGRSSGGGDVSGWDFANRLRINRDAREGLHEIMLSGSSLTAEEIDGDAGRFTFAKYIHDENAHARMPDGATNWPLRPVRADSYLLITAGVDGRYGTSDDVSNLPKFEDID